MKNLVTRLNQDHQPFEVDEAGSAYINHLHQQLEQAVKLGATGRFPDGQLNPNDEGELQLAIAHDERHVHINFGKPVQWLALPPENALELARLLVAHSQRIP